MWALRTLLRGGMCREVKKSHQTALLLLYVTVTVNIYPFMFSLASGNGEHFCRTARWSLV